MREAQADRLGEKFVCLLLLGFIQAPCDARVFSPAFSSDGFQFVLADALQQLREFTQRGAGKLAPSSSATSPRWWRNCCTDRLWRSDCRCLVRRALLGRRSSQLPKAALSHPPACRQTQHPRPHRPDVGGFTSIHDLLNVGCTGVQSIHRKRHLAHWHTTPVFWCPCCAKCLPKPCRWGGS